VANLMLMRAIRHRREIAVRVALGIARSRLMLWLVSEGIVLAAAGGLLGLLIASWSGSALRSLLFHDVAWVEPAVNSRLLVFTGMLVLLAGFVAALVPAIQAGRRDLTVELRSGGREGSGERTRTRTTLLVLQTTLCVVLLTGAGVFIRSLLRVTALDLGFEPDRVVVGLMDIERIGRSTTEVDQLFRQIEERVQSLPGVAAAAATVTVPTHWNYGTRIAVPGRDSIPVPEGGAYRNAVRPQYFSVMGIRILEGRGFTEADDASPARVAVINETMARRVWPGRSAVGECFRFIERRAVTPPPPEPQCVEIIGVATNSRHGSWLEDEIFHLHIPLSHAAPVMTQRALVARSTGRDAAQLVEPIRREMLAATSGLQYPEVMVLTRRFAGELRPWRLGATMLTAFGGLAAILAMVGLYALISFSVSTRTHEIGVRLAIGANRGTLIGLIVRQGLGIAGIGIAIGLVTALAAGSAVESLLYGVSGRDPVVVGVVLTLLLTASTAAALVPAWRASRLDPSVVLRSE
jgi:predicted permease